MSEIDKSDEAKRACRFWQQIGAASPEGRPIGTINGSPIYEVDELPPEGFTLTVSPSVFAKGEAWIRDTYQVGSDVKIVESRPLPREHAVNE